MPEQRVPVRHDLAGLEPYGAPQLDAPVRLNTNETPYAPPASFFERLLERVAELPLHRYPDRRVWALRTALGERFGLAAEQVWVASGSNEVLLQLFQAYGGHGRHLLVPRPGYSAHPLIARVTGTPVVEVDLDEHFRLDAEAARNAVAEHAPDVICVASPNNPTGLPIEPEVVRTLHDASRGLVVVDEAYAEFGSHTAVGALADLPRLVVVRTFSKAWRLAGARLGYLLGPAWVVDDLRKVRLPYHVNALAQAAGLAALDLAEEMTGHIRLIAAERERVRAALGGVVGVEVFPSEANFLLVRTRVDDVFDRLLGQGVLVRDFSRQPRLEGCIRVTIGTEEENDRFVAALKEVLR